MKALAPAVLAAVLLAVIIGLISLAGFAVRRRNGEFR